MITPFLAGSTGRAQPTAAATTSPGTSLVMAAKAVGTSAPGLIRGSATSSTPGGRMLETLMRLMLPMPAASRALSKALSGVEPSALPAVPAALVTGAKRIRSLLVALCAETAAPSHERRPTAARREFLDHRSGSAVERKQKVDFGAAWWSRREAVGERSRPRRSGPKRDFFLAMEKK